MSPGSVASIERRDKLLKLFSGFLGDDRGNGYLHRHGIELSSARLSLSDDLGFRPQLGEGVSGGGDMPEFEQQTDIPPGAPIDGQMELFSRIADIAV